MVESDVVTRTSCRDNGGNYGPEDDEVMPMPEQTDSETPGKIDSDSSQPQEVESNPNSNHEQSS